MRALVCGAGIAGLALAGSLRRDGHDVLLVERAPTEQRAGYIIDVPAGAHSNLAATGLLPELVQQALPLTELVFHDADGGVRERLTDPGAEPTVSVLRGALVAALHAELGDCAIRYGTTVDEIRSDEHEFGAVLSDGSVQRPDVLVGADGIHSRVRHLAFGPEERFLRELGFHTAAYPVTAPGPAREVAGGLHLTEGPGAQVGAYPVDDERVMTLFVHRAPPGTPLPADPGAELVRTCGGLGWIVPELLDRRPSRTDLYYDTVAKIEMPRWHRGRVVLVGDACHAPSLLAGHGADLALTGARALAARLREDATVEQALVGYERQVRPEALRLQAQGRAVAEDFVPPHSG
ncbi:FAD-dependent monooxygenase [Saccharopolyspora sp. HNM0983]|uniref:FAD-dependent monooxygenase n=1 Tax=Saccharopolyspora montiporae TaxID=2781240 RepID=A0A929B5T4_9PSEU|nr:FAD-dependent monooxygenase [Saccharopolyspora sp. HNM0983]MBE9373727.1 FAD-dependent monooxygenase [Saccharopolyspora sp. HNM0983]